MSWRIGVKETTVNIERKVKDTRNKRAGMSRETRTRTEIYDQTRRDGINRMTYDIPNKEVYFRCPLITNSAFRCLAL